jgi:hypothetical protein
MLVLSRNAGMVFARHVNKLESKSCTWEKVNGSEGVKGESVEFLSANWKSTSNGKKNQTNNKKKFNLFSSKIWF